MNSDTTRMFDPNFLRESSEIEDDGLLLELFKEFATQLRQLQKVLAESVDSPTSMQTLTQLCHNLKSSSKEIGAFQLARSLEELEQASLNNSRQNQPLFSITSYFVAATLSQIDTEIQLIGRK